MLDIFNNLFGGLFSTAPSTPQQQPQQNPVFNLFSQDPDQGAEWLSKAFPSEVPEWAPWHPEYEFRSPTERETAWNQRMKDVGKEIKPIEEVPYPTQSPARGAAYSSFRAAQETGMTIPEETNVALGPAIHPFNNPEVYEGDGKGGVVTTAPPAQPILSKAQLATMSGVDNRVIQKFGQLQGIAGQQFKIRSAYRSPAENVAVGGARRSQHMHGNALDIDVSHMSPKERVELIANASALGFTGIGVYNNTLHLDIGGRRAWGPDYTSASVPKWASRAISAHLSGQWKQTRMSLGGPKPKDLNVAQDLKAASIIVDSEARRDSKGRIRVYGLPKNDGGGKYEIAGINSRYHPSAARKLAGMIRKGDHEGAERYAAEYIKKYTDRSASRVVGEGPQYLIRDIAFNRGPGGANAIMRMALGKTPSSKKAAIRSLNATERAQIKKLSQDDPEAFIKAVTKARMDYEYRFVGKRKNLDRGLRNRWKFAQTTALNFTGDQ
jgi:hypothetical protein